MFITPQLTMALRVLREGGPAELVRAFDEDIRQAGQILWQRLRRSHPDVRKEPYAEWLAAMASFL